MTVNVDESNPDQLLEHGISLCRVARYRDAIEALLRVISLDPTKAAAHYQLGDAYNHTDQLDDALEAYEAAVKQQPDHWRALQGMGVVFDRLGRPDEATAAYQKAREAQRR